MFEIEEMVHLGKAVRVRAAHETVANNSNVELFHKNDRVTILSSSSFSRCLLRRPLLALRLRFGSSSPGCFPAFGLCFDRLFCGGFAGRLPGRLGLGSWGLSRWRFRSRDLPLLFKPFGGWESPRLFLA